MLQHIHDKSKGIVTYLIVGFLVLVFIMWGVGYYLKGFAGPSENAGEVNGRAVSQGDFDRAYQSARSQQAGMLGDAAVQSLKETVLETLMVRLLLSTSAEQLGFGLSEETLTHWILSDLSFKDASGQFSLARYNALLQQLGINSDMLRNQIRQNVLISQVQDGITRSSFALPSEVDAYASLINPIRHARLVKIPLSSFQQKSEISEDAVKAYYSSHSADFYAKKSIQIEYLDLKTPEAYSAEIDQLANLTFENPDSLAPAAKQLNLPLLKSEYFSEEGGKTPLTQNKAVLKAAFSSEVLDNKNNSDVIKISPTEAVVLRVINQQPPHPKSFEEVKPEILNLLQNQQAEKLAASALEPLKTSKDLDVQAKALGFEVVADQSYAQNNQTLPAEVTKALFDSPLKPNGQLNRILVPLTDASGWMLLDISGSVEASAEQIYEANIQLPGLWGAWEYKAYEGELIHDATIKKQI